MRVRVLPLVLAVAGPPATAQLPGPPKAGADLVAEVRQAGREIPSDWVVRNAGKGEAGPSILKIFVKLRPFDAAAAAAFASAGADAASLCRTPGRDFIELIPALKAGEARTAAAASLFPPLAPLPQALRNAGPFVCVFDVRAVADANDDVRETDEKNNAALRTVERRM